MNKHNSDENKRRISIDDDYIELLNSVDIEDEYEDIYSDSSKDIYSDSSKDVYVGRKKREESVYIGRYSRNRYEELEVDEADEKESTQEVRLTKAPPVDRRRSRNLPDEDEVSDYEDRHGKKEKRKSNPFVKVVVALLVICIALGGALMSVANSIVGEFAEGIDFEHIADVSSLASSGSVRNILLIGADKESGGSSRSDSIMICSVNSTTGKITLVSILRDTHVEVPGYRESKINAAHSWGGPELLIQTIEQNFGIMIDDYATVNFEMFEALVDGIGGIYVDVSDAEAEHMNSYFKLGTGDKPDKVQGGENVYLNGYQALCYARIRKLDSDFYRTERQQKIIGAIITNIKDKLNPANIGELMQTAKEVAPYIETTLSEADVMSLLTSLGACVLKSGGNTGKLMASAQLPFEGTWWYSSEWDGSSISVDFEENRRLLYETLYETPVQEDSSQTEE